MPARGCFATRALQFWVRHAMVWEWEDGGEGSESWTAYDGATSSALCELQAKASGGGGGGGPLAVRLGGQAYTIDLGTIMRQTNTNTGLTRRVRKHPVLFFGGMSMVALSKQEREKLIIQVYVCSR